MKTGVRMLTIAGALWMTAAHADAPGELTDADWKAAAKAALAVVERKQHVILVLEDSLSPAARTVFRGLRATVARDALPEQDKYILPPGDYLLVRKFELQGDRIELKAATGWLGRRIGGSCGTGRDIFVARGADGTWTQAGLDTMSKC